jgi:hypothetical protein
MLMPISSANMRLLSSISLCDHDTINNHAFITLTLHDGDRHYVLVVFIMCHFRITSSLSLHYSSLPCASFTCVHKCPPTCWFLVGTDECIRMTWYLCLRVVIHLSTTLTRLGITYVSIDQYSTTATSPIDIGSSRGNVVLSHTWSVILMYSKCRGF